MDNNNVRDKILEVIEEMGIMIPQSIIEKDFDLSEYVSDSLQFISMIVGIEEKLDIEIPDVLLEIQSISSFNGFCNAILCCYIA